MSEKRPPYPSRRTLLTAMLAAGASAMVRRPATAGDAAVAALPLITKKIPSTGEALPAVGVGTDNFSEGASSAIVAELARLQQLGGRVIDTAAAYGDSEQLIGETLAKLGIRSQMFVASKLTNGGSFYGGEIGGEASLERSLARLKTDHLDLLQVHNLEGVDVLMPLMQQWKRAGRIRYIGITTSRNGQHAAMCDYMRKYPLDFVQVDYSLANRDAARNVLPLAQQRGIAVLVNVPFGSGAALRRAQSRPLPTWAADVDVTNWSQLLLKYVISHPAVTCTIPGSITPSHLEDNQQAARGRLADAALRQRMEQEWDA